MSHSEKLNLKIDNEFKRLTSISGTLIKRVHVFVIINKILSGYLNHPLLSYTNFIDFAFIGITFRPKLHH